MANGGGGSGPPNKFPQWVDVSGIQHPQDVANALGAAYQTFWDTYHYWPTVAVSVGGVVYLGAYDKK